MHNCPPPFYLAHMTVSIGLLGGFCSHDICLMQLIGLTGKLLIKRMSTMSWWKEDLLKQVFQALSWIIAMVIERFPKPPPVFNGTFFTKASLKQHQIHPFLALKFPHGVTLEYLLKDRNFFSAPQVAACTLPQSGLLLLDSAVSHWWHFMSWVCDDVLEPYWMLLPALRCLCSLCGTDGSHGPSAFTSLISDVKTRHVRVYVFIFLWENHHVVKLGLQSRVPHPPPPGNAFSTDSVQQCQIWTQMKPSRWSGWSYSSGLDFNVFILERTNFSEHTSKSVNSKMWHLLHNYWIYSYNIKKMYSSYGLYLGFFDNWAIKVR